VKANAGDALAAVLLLALLTSCGPPPTPAPLAGYDVLVINIDALRADHLGCYGYARDTSPFLDSLCDEGVVFERASAASTYTRESVAALFTGRLPSKTGALGWHAAPRALAPTLAERLQASGNRTGLLSNTVMLRDPAFERGFDRSSHLPSRWGLSGEGERLSHAAIAFVREAKHRPYFLYLHYLDPHAPYAPPEGHLQRLGRPDAGPVLGLYTDVTSDLPGLLGTGFGPGDSRFESLVDRYDAEISATDAALATLFRGLSELGALDRTLVVVTSDHGEEFLEHDWVDHGWSLYEETLRVPLVFWAPAALPPERVRTRASQVDVVPTVLALLGVGDGETFDGSSIFEIEGPVVRPRLQERTHVAELLIARRQIVRAVLRDDWKYIASWRRVPPADRGSRPEATPATAPDLWGPPVREELFELRSDPGEKDDRSASEPGILSELADALAEFRDRGPNYGFSAAPSAPSPGPSDETSERLRALGYAE